MIERYTLPEMGAIWTEEAKMRAWLDVEIAAVKAWHRLGKVPREAVAEIEAKADFDVSRVAEIEATTNHDVIAFLTNVAEYVGESSKYVHYGMTSSDMLDTALALQIKRAGQLLERDQRLAVVREPARLLAGQRLGGVPARQLHQPPLLASLRHEQPDAAPAPRGEECLQVRRVGREGGHEEGRRDRRRPGVVLPHEPGEDLVVARAGVGLEKEDVAPDQAPVSDDEELDRRLRARAREAEDVLLGPGEGSHLLVLHRPFDRAHLVA